MDETSKQYVAINTHKGLYQKNRLPFGAAAAPSIFQRTLENLLQNISHVTIYLDTILVTGTSEAEHLDTLEQVLTYLETAGLILKQSKCAFILEFLIIWATRFLRKGYSQQIKRSKPSRRHRLQPMCRSCNLFWDLITAMKFFQI